MATDRILQHPQPLDPFDDIPVAYAVFQLIFDAAHSQVVNTRYVYVNRAYCRMAGCAREDLVGRNFLDLYPEGVLWFPYCQEAWEKKETVHACLYSNETGHWLDFTVGPAGGEDRVAFIFTIMDETVQKTRRETTTHALEELSRFIHPDRLYVLETDGITASNTFEWCAPGVEPEMETLQGLDYDGYLSGWEKYLKRSGDVVISDIEELKADDPNRGKLIGYLGADNYEKNDLINTQLVLNSISYFIGAKIVNHRLMEDLNRLSCTDTLTNVYNRNAMMAAMKTLSEQEAAVGLVYADVNGLKCINDRQGHEAGDQALQHAADTLSNCFGREKVYRAGGDEFVVILPKIGREAFEERWKALQASLYNDGAYSFSVGAKWCSDSTDIEEALRIADRHMYEEKERFYRIRENDRRKNRG